MMKRRRKRCITKEVAAVDLADRNGQLDEAKCRRSKAMRRVKTRKPKTGRSGSKQEVSKVVAQETSAATSLKNSFIPREGPYTFEPDPMDHCETDRRAYRHLKPVLLRLERAIYGKNAGDLRVWDPYYCDGSIKRNLAALGFPKVHNENEDFYEVVRTGKLPEHDVLVTSPPYSQDHLERCMRFCASSVKPWCALLPNWVFGKDFYQDLLRTAPTMSEQPPIYLGPLEPYQYWFPQGANQRPDHVGSDGATTPYKTSWFICLPNSLGGSGLLEHLQDKRKSADWVVAKTVRGLKWLARKAEARRAAPGGGAAQPKRAGRGEAGSKGSARPEKRARQGGLEVVPLQAPAANALSPEGGWGAATRRSAGRKPR